MPAATNKTQDSAPIVKEKILAERFKTQMCRNYERKGSCPYENKCMFAHGDDDVRTPEMNVRDGLFTEEAIEAYRRAQRLLRKRANQAARQAAAAERALQSATNIASNPIVQTKVFAAECQRAGRPSFLSTPTTPSMSVSPAAVSPRNALADVSSTMSTVGEAESQISECESVSDVNLAQVTYPTTFHRRLTSDAIPIAKKNNNEEAISPHNSSHGSTRSLGLGGLSASNSISQSAPRLVFRHNPYAQPLQMSPTLTSSSQY